MNSQQHEPLGFWQSCFGFLAAGFGAVLGLISTLACLYFAYLVLVGGAR